MTYQATGYIRDYNGATDTATVELIGLGIIDTWLDGCTINAGVNRGYLTHGAEVLLSIPDAHRLCEASIVSINSSTATGAQLANSAGPQRIQTGRVRIPTNGAGGGSITVVFPSSTPGPTSSSPCRWVPPPSPNSPSPSPPAPPRPTPTSTAPGTR